MMSIVLFAIQILLLAVLAFGDIGFDRPGRFGLSFGHGVAIAGLYLLMLLLGVACSIHEKRWGTSVPQILVPLVIAAVLFLPVLPAPRYDAADYQHLVGKSRSDVESILSPRNAVTGIEWRDGQDCKFTSYQGMTVIYTPQGHVSAVVPNPP